MKRIILTMVLVFNAIGMIWCNLPVAAEPSQSDPVGTISGQVLVAKKVPMKNGVVLLFNQASGPPPSVGKYWRVPDIIIPADSTGHFSISVDNGIYYLQIAQKSPDGEIGPPPKHEYFYFHGDKTGKPIPLIVNSKPLKLGKLVAKLYSPKMDGVTSIEGKVTDKNGVPVEHMVVFAHISEQLRGRPTFVSSKTDKNGMFVLRVHEGTYFLKARNKIGGGPPKSGEMQNVDDDGESVKVTVIKDQRLKGIILRVNTFSGKGEAESVDSLETEKVWKNLKNIQSK